MVADGLWWSVMILVVGGRPPVGPSVWLGLKQTKAVVFSHITFWLDQNDSILIGLPMKSLGRLQLIQHAPARLITGLKKKQRTRDPNLEAGSLAPNRTKLVFKVLLLTYKRLDNKGTSYLKQLLIPNMLARSLCTSSENLLCVPATSKRETQKCQSTSWMEQSVNQH